MKKIVLPLLAFALIGPADIKDVEARGNSARARTSIRPARPSVRPRAYNQRRSLAARPSPQQRAAPVRTRQLAPVRRLSNVNAAPKEMGWLRRTNHELSRSTTTGGRLYRLAKNGLKLAGAATLVGLGTAAALSSAPLGFVAAGLVGGGYYLAGRTTPHIANDIAGGTPFDKSFAPKAKSR